MALACYLIVLSLLEYILFHSQRYRMLISKLSKFTRIRALMVYDLRVWTVAPSIILRIELIMLQILET